MEKVDKNGLTEQEFLRSYSPKDYARPSVAADIVLFTVAQSDADSYRKLPQKVLKVLLIARGGHPFLGQWALPGGFVRPHETARQAATRELKEETGVSDLYLDQLYMLSDPGRDPRTWVMSCSYIALIDSSKQTICAGDDAANAAWFELEYALIREEKTRIQDVGIFTYSQQYALKLQGEDQQLSAVIERKTEGTQPYAPEEYSIVTGFGLAFDHAKIVAYALEQLRKKLQGTDIALHLMPEKFTLTELQQVYEVILGKSLLKAAFRRKIAHMVEETDQYTENAGHRPSRLYRRRAI